MRLCGIEIGWIGGFGVSSAHVGIGISLIEREDEEAYKEIFKLGVEVIV
jgi:hypothetical protein